MTKTERIAKLEDEIGTLRTEQAELLRQQARFEVEVWQGRVEDLEVQVHLAAMEAEDKLQPLLDKLLLTWGDARGQLIDATTTTTGVAETLRAGLSGAVSEIRKALLESKEIVTR